MFLNGVATVTAGTTAEVEATWMLPLAASAFAAATASWEVIDKTGAVWSSGDADDLRTVAAPVGTDTHVIAVATIGVPVDAPADNQGTSYQVRWTLVYGGQTTFAFDSFTVYPRVVDLQGPANAVNLWNNPTQVILTLPDGNEQSVKCMVYYQNTPVGEYLATSAVVAEGRRYFVDLPCDFPQGPSLTPYNLIWKYGPPNQQLMENANLWLINPTILQAQTEVRQFLLKAYSGSGVDPDQEFEPHVLLSHLLQGCELFNALGYPTSFTMIRASGAIRSLWLRCATIQACRAQYMHEGMKAFDYGGQVVTLNVDRSQYWDSLASNLQSELDQAIKPFKENLVRRGLLSGDGNVDANSLRYGAVGAIGVAITPVSPLRGIARPGFRSR